MYAIILEHEQDPLSLDERLDEPLPWEIDEQQARQLEVRRQARENRDALGALRGMPVQRGG